MADVRLSEAETSEIALGVGVRVRSKQIGRRVAFSGVIVAQVVGGWNVRDAEGNLWLRQSNELQRIKEKKKAS